MHEKKQLSLVLQKKCQKFAGEKKLSHIAALLELGIFSPEQLWEKLEGFFKEDNFWLFDSPKAEFFFNSEQVIQEHDILVYIPSLEFIQQGVRKMGNHRIIKTHLPAQDNKVQLLNPGHLSQIYLNPPESYLYNLIEHQNHLKQIYNSSHLGIRESQKIMFNFTSLGIVGPPQNQSQEQAFSELSHADLVKVLDNFNEKCSFIFKYISKEIGPAALNVLEKCYEDAKAYLSPLFQNVTFDTEGRIESNSIVRVGTGLQGLDFQKALLRDINEILAAEILAVKKTLGNDHEADLIKILTNVGE